MALMDKPQQTAMELGRTRKMATQIVVTVPYEDDLSFVLDPSSKGMEGKHKARIMTELADGYTDLEIEVIITSAAALFAMRAGPIHQCLDTAIVWLRG